jgi:hypothetical protein
LSLSPKRRLWTSVLLGCISDIENGLRPRAAWAWINDPENIFFDIVADSFGWHPLYLRRKLKETVKTKSTYRIRGIRMIAKKTLPGFERAGFFMATLLVHPSENHS